MVYQFKYDSSQGTFRGDVKTDGTNLIVNGKTIVINQELSAPPFSFVPTPLLTAPL